MASLFRSRSKPAAAPAPGGAPLRQMSLLEHLEELRKRLLHAALSVVAAFCLTYAYHQEIFQTLALPLTKHLPPEGNLVFLKLQEPFTLYLKVAFFAALILAAPYILYQLWLFISPGLYRHEKQYAIPFLFFSSLLFLAGCGFAYFVAFPSACAFFIELGQPYTPNIDIDHFFDLALFIIAGMGAVFQLPVVIAFLAMMGVVTPQFLLKKFRHAIIIIFIAAAVISPTTDAINLFLFAGPMLVLYILSIGVAAIFYWRKKKARERAAAEGNA